MSDRDTYRITWSAEDGEHVGLCAEFPLLSWPAPTSGQGAVRESGGSCAAASKT